jgi:hypothetical protein
MEGFIKRKDYLDGKATHSEYYAQFVGDEEKALVLRYVGMDKLMASRDEHLNDIKLGTWDTIPLAYDMKFWRTLGDFPTPAGKVCILKEAARQIIQANA